MNNTFEDKKETVLVALGILGQHVRAEVAEAAVDPTPDTVPLRHATERFEILCRATDALSSFEEADDATQAESDGACRVLIETLYDELARVRPFVCDMEARDFEMLVYLLDAALDRSIEAEHVSAANERTRNARVTDDLTHAARESSDVAWGKLATAMRELPSDHYVTEPFSKKPAALARARRKVATLTFDAEDLERFGVDAKKVVVPLLTADDCERFGLDLNAVWSFDAETLERLGVDFTKLPYADEICASWEDMVMESVEDDGDGLCGALMAALADHDLEYTGVACEIKNANGESSLAEPSES